MDDRVLDDLRHELSPTEKTNFSTWITRVTRGRGRSIGISAYPERE